MKKTILMFAALASVALVSCTDDMLVQDTATQPTDVEEGGAIIFGSLSKGMTRADFFGAEAAQKLGNKFVVAGKKGATTAATDGTIVFDNYLVEYEENTAHTTASNVANWEYVGKGLIKHASDHGITSQTIKYWDYSKAQYDFIAWSTGSKTAIYEGTPAAGQVLVSAINPNATASAAYTFTGTAADLSQCYIADLVTVKKADYARYENENPVTFQFRQLGTKVRIAIYETIPGYSVKNVEFYSAAASDDASPAAAKLFSTVANGIYTEGTYTVTFPTVDGTTADNNQAHVAFAPKTGATEKSVIDWGTLNYTIAEEGEKTAGNVFLGRTSGTASFAGNEADNYYVIFLPNESGTNLNLRVNYTLESIDGGGEEIIVKGATAQVPSIYTQWKPGFAYTYIFKISDKTNGHTGVYDPTHPDDTTINSDPSGLWPITFDAVVENSEDNDATQETITTVMTPSITSYQKESTVVNANEYTVNGQDIFVTVNEGDALVTMTNTDPATDKDAALYTIPAGKTEAEVVDALQMQDDDAATGTVKGRSGLVLTEAAFTLTDKVEFGVDGNAISVSSNQALRFTPAAATTYAFVYTKTAPTTTTNMYQPVTKADGDAVNGLYRYALVAAPAGDMQKGVKYFPANDASAGMITPFIGQGVGNLYLDNAGNQIASGYAVTGTTYYYTTDHGMTYQAATNIAYADFATTTLYKDPALTTPKTETTPVDGQAYYDATGKYCVILPQQTTGFFVIDNNTANNVACASADVAVNGMTYFDKYAKNNGVYYVKVIKVQ